MFVVLISVTYSNNMLILSYVIYYFKCSNSNLCASHWVTEDDFSNLEVYATQLGWYNLFIKKPGAKAKWLCSNSSGGWCVLFVVSCDSFMQLGSSSKALQSESAHPGPQTHVHNDELSQG